MITRFGAKKKNNNHTMARKSENDNDSNKGRFTVI